MERERERVRDVPPRSRQATLATIGQRAAAVSVALLTAALFLLIPQITHAATKYWVGGNGDNVGTNANDWSTTDPASCNDGAGDASAVPGASDIATFDPDCDSNATIAANWSVAGINITSGYSGTVSQSGSSTLTVGTSDYVQSDGTFTGGSGSITMNDAFTISGGTFTSTSGTLTVGAGSATGAWTHTAGGTFNHNNGTVKWAGNGVTWDVNTSESFYNLDLDCNGSLTCSSGALTITSGDTLVVTNTFTHTDGVINNGTIEAQSTVTVGSAADGRASGRRGDCRTPAPA